MGSTEILNRTSRALDIKAGNCRYLVDLATVESNQSHTLNVTSNDSYMELSLGVTDAAGKPILVNSDECVDNQRIIVLEVDGKFHIEKEPRVASNSAQAVNEAQKSSKRPCTFWTFGLF